MGGASESAAAGPRREEGDAGAVPEVGAAAREVLHRLRLLLPVLGTAARLYRVPQVCWYPSSRLSTDRPMH